jgi:hypothetical protein
MSYQRRRGDVSFPNMAVPMSSDICDEYEDSVSDTALDGVAARNAYHAAQKKKASELRKAHYRALKEQQDLQKKEEKKRLKRERVLLKAESERLKYAALWEALHPVSGDVNEQKTRRNPFNMKVIEGGGAVEPLSKDKT